MLIKGLPVDVLGSLAMQRLSFDWEQENHVFLCLADHYEPMVGKAPLKAQRERVDRWMEQYPRMCEGIEDSRGRPPQHSFFYPAEEYRAEFIDRLASLCRAGYGDVEVHLHHDNDTAENLEEVLLGFTEALADEHGLLRRDASGVVRYGFIHGNWALDNSRPDGRWCGVDNELSVLKKTGCYADFTLPSAPSPTQTRTVNSIYYATGREGSRKSHDYGEPALVGREPSAESLLMIQGPLGLDWTRRKFGVLPKLENGDLLGNFPPTRQRLDQWLKARVQVQGQPSWHFIKLHTHGANESNTEMLLGQPMIDFHASLAEVSVNHPSFHYYYATAWEMAQLVRQAERGRVQPAFDFPVEFEPVLSASRNP